MREVTIKLSPEILTMLDDWREKRINDHQRHMELSSDKKLKEVFSSFCEVEKQADYDYLVENYLKHAAFFGGGTSNED